MSWQIQINLAILYGLLLAQIVFAGLSFRVRILSLFCAAIAVFSLGIGIWTILESFSTGLAGVLPYPSVPEWELMMVLLGVAVIATTFMGILAAGNIKK